MFSMDFLCMVMGVLLVIVGVLLYVMIRKNVNIKKDKFTLKFGYVTVATFIVFGFIFLCIGIFI